MILLKRSISDLAAAYQQICEFNQTLEDTWIPGFYRSYERRQAAYLNAVQRYEERSKLTRLIFKKPKPPGRPSPGLQKEIAGRLWQDWTGSLRFPLEDETAGDELSENSGSAENDHLVNALVKRMDDRFFAITELQTSYEETPVTAVVGPTGGWIVSAIQDDQTQLTFKPLPDLDFSQLPDSRSTALEKPERDIIDQLVVFQIIDDLLSYHQDYHTDDTISAQREAERLMSREKDSLLKLAATL